MFWSNKFYLICLAPRKSFASINLAAISTSHLRSEIRELASDWCSENGLPNLATFRHHHFESALLIYFSDINQSHSRCTSTKLFKLFPRTCVCVIWTDLISHPVVLWTSENVQIWTIWRPTTTSLSTPSICQSASWQDVCMCVIECMCEWLCNTRKGSIAQA